MQKKSYVVILAVSVAWLSYALNPISHHFIWFALWFPSAPLLIAWFQTFRHKDNPEDKSTSSLAVSTVSFAWLITAIRFPILMGAEYSNIRFLIIGLNIFATLLAAAVALYRSYSPVASVGMFSSCLQAAIASLLTSLAWGYVGAINQTV